MVFWLDVFYTNIFKYVIIFRLSAELDLIIVDFSQDIVQTEALKKLTQWLWWKYNLLVASQTLYFTETPTYRV